MRLFALSTAACDALPSLLTLAVIGLAAFGLGRPLVRRLALPEHESLLVVVWSLALGLVAGGFLWLALAWVGGIDSYVIVAVSLAAVLWSLVELSCSYLGWAGGRLIVGCPPAERDEPPALDPAGKLLAAVAAVGAAASLFMAIAPANSPAVLRDALKIPQSILLHGGLDTSGAARLPLPTISQTWFLWALALDGPAAAGLVQWGLGLLLALAVTLLSREFLSAPQAALAGCLVLLCPGVQSQMSVPAADLALALFATLALHAVIRTLVHFDAAPWPIAGGVALGAAAAADTAGAPLAAAIAALWVLGCAAPSELWSQRLRAAGTMAALATLVAAPWILPAWPAIHAGLPQSARSVAAHLGPVLIVAFAGLVFARRLRGLHFVLAVLAAYTLAACVGPWAGRSWSILAPLAAVVAAWTWHEMARFPRIAALAARAVLCMLAVAQTAGQAQRAVRSPDDAAERTASDEPVDSS